MRFSIIPKPASDGSLWIVVNFTVKLDLQKSLFLNQLKGKRIQFRYECRIAENKITL